MVSESSWWARVVVDGGDLVDGCTALEDGQAVTWRQPGSYREVRIRVGEVIVVICLLDQMVAEGTVTCL
jgi:hypothetical protein